MNRFSGAFGWTLLLAVGMAGAANADTLYARLGGTDGVAAIANELIDRTAADPVLGRSFKDSNLKRIKQHLAEQFCKLAGGGCAYTGDDMREVHAGHDIREAEFYGMVDLLTGIMKSRRIALGDRNEFLALLAPLKRDVVRIPPDTH